MKGFYGDFLALCLGIVISGTVIFRPIGVLSLAKSALRQLLFGQKLRTALDSGYDGNNGIFMHCISMIGIMNYQILSVLHILTTFVPIVGFLFSPSSVRAQSEVESVRLAEPCVQGPETIRLSFLNVGQGDSTLIQCPDQQTQVLIDAGDGPDRYPGAIELFLTALDQRLPAGDTLDIALLTHPHPDHSHGFLALLERVANNQLRIGQYFDDGVENVETDIDNRIREKVANLAIPHRNVIKEGLKKIPLCNTPFGAVDLRLVYPTGPTARKLHCPGNFNDCSIVSHFNYAGFQVNLMADATTAWEALAETLPRYPLPHPATILKVGHHGSASPSELFISRMRPLFAVISSGDPKLGNTALFGYPKLHSLAVLEKNATKQPFAEKIPAYELSACEQNSTNGQCRWTNTVVPSTLLATAALGSIDMYLQPGQLCVQTEQFRVGIYYTFSQ